VPRLSAVLALAAALVLPAGGPALAEPPFKVPGQVTDHAGVLSGEGLARVSGALSRLQSEDQVRLFVVYIDSFDGARPDNWATDTSVRSGLGPGDVLFAVAIDDGFWGYSVGGSLPLLGVKMDELVAQHVIPELSAGNFDAAAVALALAEGLRGGGQRGGGPRGDDIGLGSVAVLVGAVALLGGWFYVLIRPSPPGPGPLGGPGPPVSGGSPPTI
jgi:uncharacterized membrane protein YgcG